MTTYTYSQARQHFASVLDRANIEGQAMIKRKDGSLFVVKPVRRRRSPLDVEGVNAGLTAREIVEIVREGRERGLGTVQPRGAHRSGEARRAREQRRRSRRRVS